MGMGWFYDQLVLFRYVIPHFKRIVNLEDFLYWQVMAAQLFYLLLTYHRGEIRSYIVAGLMAGGLLYVKVIGPVYLAVMKKLLYPFYWIRLKIFRKLKDKH